MVGKGSGTQFEPQLLHLRLVLVPFITYHVNTDRFRSCNNMQAYHLQVVQLFQRNFHDLSYGPSGFNLWHPILLALSPLTRRRRASWHDKVPMRQRLHEETRKATSKTPGNGVHALFCCRHPQPAWSVSSSTPRCIKWRACFVSLGSMICESSEPVLPVFLFRYSLLRFGLPHWFSNSGLLHLLGQAAVDSF